jgi:hypothetical protein
MIFPIVDLLYKHSIKDLPWIYVITELHWDFDGPAEPISGNFKERADVLFSGVEVGGLCSFLSESHTLPCASLVCKSYIISGFLLFYQNTTSLSHLNELEWEHS